MIWMTLNTCFCKAQVTYMQNMYQVNDLIERQQVNPASISENPDALVDLQNMETNGDNDVENMEWGTDSLIAIDNGGMRKYCLKGDSLLLVGTENRLMHIDYAQPEVWLRFPMSLGDSISGLFEGKGQYCERLFLRKIGRYTTKADASGSLLMENSDTLHNVLRIQTERITTYINETLKTEKDALAATLEDAEAELKEAKNAALEQEKKALALSYYADLTDALRRGDFDAAAQASVRLAGMKSWLDDKYLAGYQEFLDSLNPQPEPEEETENTEEEGENHD